LVKDINVLLRGWDVIGVIFDLHLLIAVLLVRRGRVRISFGLILVTVINAAESWVRDWVSLTRAFQWWKLLFFLLLLDSRAERTV